MRKEGVHMQDRQTPVLINLLAIARYDRMPDYPIQFMTRGTLVTDDEGSARIEYTESIRDEDSGEVTESCVSLALEKNRVTMTRNGEFSNTMVFIPEQRFEGVYHTPYGEMNMGVFSRGVQCDIGSTRGSVHLKYQLDIQGSYASSNELHLEYTAEKEGRVQ